MEKPQIAENIIPIEKEQQRDKEATIYLDLLQTKKYPLFSAYFDTHNELPKNISFPGILYANTLKFIRPEAWVDTKPLSAMQYENAIVIDVAPGHLLQISKRDLLDKNIIIGSTDFTSCTVLLVEGKTSILVAHLYTNVMDIAQYIEATAKQIEEPSERHISSTEQGLNQFQEILPHSVKTSSYVGDVDSPNDPTRPDFYTLSISASGFSFRGVDIEARGSDDAHITPSHRPKNTIIRKLFTK